MYVRPNRDAPFAVLGVHFISSRRKVKTSTLRGQVAAVLSNEQRAPGKKIKRSRARLLPLAIATIIVVHLCALVHANRWVKVEENVVGTGDTRVVTCSNNIILVQASVSSEW